MPPLPRNSTPPASGFRVLVVEDEFLIAMDLDGLLREAGFQVLGPDASVADALDRIAMDRPDAAVLDVSLRGERVTPVAEALRLLKVPFVLTSAYGADDLAGEPSLAMARNLGKPTSANDLVQALRQLLESAEG